MIVGLGMLFFSSFAKIKYTGPTIALSLAIALAASLTLAPALLALLRGAIFWPFRAAAPAGRRPGRVARARRGADVGVLGAGRRPGRPAPGRDPRGLPVGPVPLAVVGARARPNYNQLADLDPDRPSVIGSDGRSGATSPSAS